MHPILFEIPLGWLTIAVLAVLLGLGAVIRSRFAPSSGESSYLMSTLGLSVDWSKVAAPWSKALGAGAVQAVVVGAIASAALWFARQKNPELDSLPLHTYGVMMATAFIVAIALATRQARFENLPSAPLRDKKGRQLVDKSGKKLTISPQEMVADLAFYALLAGLGGSRVLYIFTRWSEEYSRDPMKVFRIWEGGLVWYGGLIGATLTIVWFVRSRKVRFLPYGDLLVPGVALAHGIGRLGCFAAGCCFGNVAAPWFPFPVSFPQNSPAFHEHLGQGLVEFGAASSLPVYPTQLIEAGGEVIIFLILLFVRKRKKFQGQVLLTYFYLYPLLRSVIEMFRGDNIRGFFFRWPSEEAPLLLSTSQGVSLLVAIAGISLTIVLSRQAKTAANTQVTPAA